MKRILLTSGVLLCLCTPLAFFHSCTWGKNRAAFQAPKKEEITASGPAAAGGNRTAARNGTSGRVKARGFPTPFCSEGVAKFTTGTVGNAINAIFHGRPWNNYLVADERIIVDITPPQGSTYRSIVIQSKGSIYNQNYEKVSSVVFRVTEGLRIYTDEYADEIGGHSDPDDFMAWWVAPDWLFHPEHMKAISGLRAAPPLSCRQNTDPDTDMDTDTSDSQHI